MISRRSATSLALLALLLSGCGVAHRAEQREAAAERAFPPEGEFVEVSGGRRVHAVVRGHGPALVLIHGASGNTRDFTFSFVDRVSDRYRVIVFDRPGLGYTDRANPRSYADTPAEQAAMLHEAAVALGARHPIVLGHSYGGAVAMAWGLDFEPAALVIESGATEPWQGNFGEFWGLTVTQAGGATVVPLVAAFAPQSQVNRMIAMIFSPQPVPDGYAESVGAGLALRRDTFLDSARQLKTLRPQLRVMSPRYPAISVPVEIVHGARDPFVPPSIHAVPLSEQIAGANITLLEGIGHMPHHVAPDAVEAAIDRAARRARLR